MFKSVTYDQNDNAVRFYGKNYIISMCWIIYYLHPIWYVLSINNEEGVALCSCLFILQNKLSKHTNFPNNGVDVIFFVESNGEFTFAVTHKFR